MEKIKIAFSDVLSDAKDKLDRRFGEYIAKFDGITWADDEDEYDTTVIITIDHADFGKFILDTIAFFKSEVKVDDAIWRAPGADVSVRVVDGYDD